MNNPVASYISAILIGIGATFTTDLWALFLERAFRIPAPDIFSIGLYLFGFLVGRLQWIFA